ncbi:hypothetical protein APH_0831 [Anaplasma phagocytophilum str. HZ]|uniref:Uncharacterized protein n=1 Tax=Anaplasma phagocytophilum (strain HZ) TaxID=212042 RepID=Q2GJP3_ANAPZ|nr:hypothetical protein APH_0831 [Anaplasma phagocytophilum str. HZ]
MIYFLILCFKLNVPENSTLLNKCIVGIAFKEGIE